MKTVILFRHGKSDWSASYSLDHDRPVANRGIKAAKRMGLYLREIDNIPDRVISSTALRAHTTAQLAIESGGWNRELNLDRDLYGASPGTVMAVLGEQDDSYDTVCITGHEPTMSSFIYQYTDAGYLRFPTATMARIDFDINSWSALGSSRGSLRWLTRPKELD